ncbi:MAG: TPR repeat-containing serine/threonine protein kinase [Chloroflexi bacterium OLB15]|nr:MAG: TPR repeat-containing serine/threonine protein kinase [Chloroflexi bacterium OLB15]
MIWYHNNLIDILLDMGRKADALSASEAAVSALPDNSMAWARRGLAQRRTGSYRASVESYARALELDPNYGWAWNGFGLAHLSQHHYEDAADAFERAVQLNPKDVWFWRNLGDAS